MNSHLETLLGHEAAAMLLEDYGGSLAKLVLREPCAAYSHPGMAVLQAAVALVKAALCEEMEQRDCVNSPEAMKDWLRLNLAGREHEVFVAIFLDSQHRVLALEEMFRGTLTQTSVYPREVVKRVLAVNAQAVVFAHNHPSGTLEPSRADELLTQTLKSTLALVDVRVLDHFIITDRGIMSFAERGLM